MRGPLTYDEQIRAFERSINRLWAVVLVEAVAIFFLVFG